MFDEIIRAVINLSATLDLNVVAEGIETASHHFFSKPVDAAAIETLLASQPVW